MRRVLWLARRKQGGSQSLNDQAKGNAKSAGAQLRRYGEQALRDVSLWNKSCLIRIAHDTSPGHPRTAHGLGRRAQSM